MPMAKLVLEHGQQVGNDIQPLSQQPNALVHLEIAAHGLVDGLELGLDPEELGRVEDRAVEVDVDAQDEELADLHVDLRAAQGNLARQRDLRRYVLARLDRRRDQLLEEGCLGQVSFQLCYTGLVDGMAARPVLLLFKWSIFLP